MFEQNEVIPELFERMYDLEPRRIAKSILGNIILASHSVASIFLFIFSLNGNIT